MVSLARRDRDERAKSILFSASFSFHGSQTLRLRIRLETETENEQQRRGSINLFTWLAKKNNIPYCSRESQPATRDDDSGSERNSRLGVGWRRRRRRRQRASSSSFARALNGSVSWAITFCFRLLPSLSSRGSSDGMDVDSAAKILTTSTFVVIYVSWRRFSVSFLSASASGARAESRSFCQINQSQHHRGCLKYGRPIINGGLCYCCCCCCWPKLLFQPAVVSVLRPPLLLLLPPNRQLWPSLISQKKTDI